MPTPSENKPPGRCYASQHLSPQEYGLYEVCMRLSKGGTNPLYFDGRTMARRFGTASKSGIYRDAKSLTDKGWLDPGNDGAGKKVNARTRRYKATTYTVLSHEEWTAVHGCSECISGNGTPVPSTGMDQQVLSKCCVTPNVSSGNGASPKYGNVQSQNSEIPVPSLGHSLVVSLKKESLVGGSFVQTPESQPKPAPSFSISKSQSQKREPELTREQRIARQQEELLAWLKANGREAEIPKILEIQKRSEEQRPALQAALRAHVAEELRRLGEDPEYDEDDRQDEESEEPVF